MQVFSLIWGIGNNLFEKASPSNTKKLSQVIKGKILKIFVTFPIEGDLFDFYLDFKRMNIGKWTDLLKSSY